MIPAEGEQSTYGELAALVVTLTARLDVLETRVAELEAENAELRRQLGMNSRSSSKPPSSDG
ncbi:DUF6444 domain-containing protein [Sphaerimonospora thailandensis]|uniref:DUF6444 domain-containing protein n=1 Tax=Sphaerimonospora thailandensis TaxID=795644 RepID=A0A8J3VZG3_9ACTN|nr:DUF6444 domain-containing protein [Sphaerimonospora thailandensis]GIH69856.1 hypothetical protein Mth01_21090 [Sphaerimonospora thailandensis]